jgi:preprotein translocase subunit SecG
MILANADWLSISITLLLIVFVIVCLLMSLLILMQRPKQEGLGAAFGSGMTDQMFGARTTNVLQRGTVYLACAFFFLTITLAILFARKNERQYSLKKDEPVAIEEAAAEATESAETPALETDTPAPSLEDELESAPVSGETSTAEETPVVEEPAAEESPVDAATEETPAEPAAEEAAAEEVPSEPAAEETPAEGEQP